MNKNLSQLDNLIVEILREKNLLQEQAPVAKTKQVESLPFPKLAITENWGDRETKHRNLLCPSLERLKVIQFKQR